MVIIKRVLLKRCEITKNFEPKADALKLANTQIVERFKIVESRGQLQMVLPVLTRRETLSVLIFLQTIQLLASPVNLTLVVQS
jgi:hypothetical protein